MKGLSIYRACVLVFLLPLLYSCSSYNQQVSQFYSSMAEGNYEKADHALDRNRLLKKSRNRLLYLLEKGKLAHMLGQFEKSNTYFNEADLLMESVRYSAKDFLAGNFMNPMMETYRGEDFEKYMVHYYKALNYLQLNQPGEALVEAKRISLRTYAQEDETRNRDRYTRDAFSLMLQGMIYEKNGDWNDAFIAYRNAAELYIGNDNRFYGISFPDQLKKDLLRMAYLNGFQGELEYFENLLGTRFDPGCLSGEGELIVFWENGLAPVKEAQYLGFSLHRNAGNDLVFRDEFGHFEIPFDYAATGHEAVRPESLGALLVSVPKYIAQPLYYRNALVVVNGHSYFPEAAQCINDLAFTTLKQRWLKEVSKTLTRLAIKKMAEVTAGIVEKEAREKAGASGKKEEKNKAYAATAMVYGLKLFRIASEKPDTRNWQSLPHTIHFTRVPLKQGENEVSIQVQGSDGVSKTVNFNLSSTGGLQFYSLSTLRN